MFAPSQHALPEGSPGEFRKPPHGIGVPGASGPAGKVATNRTQTGFPAIPVPPELGKRREKATLSRGFHHRCENAITEFRARPLNRPTDPCPIYDRSSPIRRPNGAFSRSGVESRQHSVWCPFCADSDGRPAGYWTGPGYSVLQNSAARPIGAMVVDVELPDDACSFGGHRVAWMF